MQDFIANIWPSPSRTVYIAFAGGPLTQYQFGRTLKDAGCSYVLMKDSTQNHYQHGVHGIGDMNAVLNFIRDLKRQYYVVTVGVSSGGYAALLYGQLAPVDEMIVFSPLTGREVDDFDPKWHSIIVDPAQAHMKDLRQFFKEGPIPHTTAYISDGEATDCDRQMCTRVGIKNIVKISGYSHGALARGMRDMGLFRRMFNP